MPLQTRGCFAARGMGLREFAEALRGAGVGVVQWRAKGLAAGEVLAGAAVLREVFAGTETLLVMNDRVDLALLAGFGGVHVGQGDLGVEDVRRVVGSVRGVEEGKVAEFVVGLSTHVAGEVTGAGEVDYVAVGPVFGTRTKLDAAAVVGLDGVRRARALTTKPLVAIGGITLANCASVRAAGADLCAVISGLLVAGRTVRDVAREFVEKLGDSVEPEA